MPNAGPVVVSSSRPAAYRRKKRRDARDEPKMDANRLIAEVFRRPALWNQRHVSYHNREVTNRVWMEMSSIFKLPKPVLKAKWKGLRDTFRAELKKEQVYGKHKCQRNRPLWIHFESLQFLKEQMIPRPPIWDCNNCNEEDCNKHQTAVNGDDNSLRDFGDSLSEHIVAKSATESTAYQEKYLKIDQAAQSSNSQCHTSSSVNGSEDSEIMMQNISPEDVLLNASTGTNGYSEMNGEGDSDSSIGIPIDYFNNHHHDDNYYFFVSLLPHMKQLSAEKRMFLRMKIQELVYNEVYRKNMTSS